MAKKICRILCIILIGVMFIFPSACSFFDEGETGRQIENVYSRHSDEDACTYIVIEYVGDEYENDIIVIPDSAKGEAGTSILGVSYENGNLVVVYSDGKQQTIPLNARFIEGVETKTDPDTGAVILKITFTDGSTPVEFVVAPGRDGDTITDIYTEVDENGNAVVDENGNIVVHVVVRTFDEESGEWINDDRTFTIPQGQPGNGITSITVNPRSNSDANYFYLNIFYDNGSVQELQIARTNSWYAEAGVPDDSKYSVGDFYFDTKGFAIYQKKADGWQLLVDFSAYSTAEHTVNFYFDDGRNGLTENIKHGYTFVSAGKTVPTPTPRAGYRFLGWFTEYVDPDDDEAVINPNSGHFTDLTPVMSNLNLYARWEKIS